MIRLAIGVVGGGSEARYKGVGNLQREWGGAGRLLSGGGQSGVAFAVSAQAKGVCVVSTILPVVFVAAIVIALGVFLVARGAKREIRASNQSLERAREEWRAGGCVGPEPVEYKRRWGEGG